MTTPHYSAVAADSTGRIVDLPHLSAAGRSRRDVRPLDPGQLIPLPRCAPLYLLPGRPAVGFDRSGKLQPAGGGFTAVAAFLPPGYTALSLAAFARTPDAPLLPLYCYCAVCWHRGRFHVPAARVDNDPKHNPSQFDSRQVAREVRRRLKKFPRNRLIAHHGQVCALRYGCPNAVNLFLNRWEAPVAASGGCNAACRGCISEQKQTSIHSPQDRIAFVPTVEEIIELAVPHLETAPRAMVSFGQGCEGEPLLRGTLIEKAIREIRRHTRRGTLHINTNGSRPAVVARLIGAGLDSIRVSLNSAREPLYSAYYRPRGYGFADVLETLCLARAAGLWVSLNYLTFPGVTDEPAEYRALARLLRKCKPDMIQWRNLNIDPDAYMDIVDRAAPARKGKAIGIPELMSRIRRDFPAIRFGYFNPPGKNRAVDSPEQTKTNSKNAPRLTPPHASR